MNNNIAAANHYLEEEGLIYLEDIKQVGIHVRGLARLLDCDPKTVQRMVEDLDKDQVLEAALQTATGEKTVTFIMEKAVISVLKSAALSTKISPETKQNALDLFERFALAGLKLIAMMKIAPEKLGIATKPTPPELQSLTDLTEAQIYNLMAYAEAKNARLLPSPELIAGIPPFFLDAPFEALALAHDKRILADRLARRLANSTFSEVHKTRGFEEEDERELISEFTEDVRKMESDSRFKVPFDKFESTIRAAFEAGIDIAALPAAQG